MKTQNSNPQISNEEIIKANLEIVDYFVGEKGGMVVIYKIEPENELENFYVASFDDMTTDLPWGLGYTPEDALEDATKKWDEKSDTEEERKDNPFRQVLEQKGE